MTRTDLVKTALRAIEREARDIDPDGPGDHLVNAAAAAIDALFPYVHTVDQLLNLPEGSLLVGRDGKSWWRSSHRTIPWEGTTGGGYGQSDGNLTEITTRFFQNERPLMVVWRP